MSEIQARTFTDLLSPALLSELRRIELKTRRAINTDLIGNYRSAFKGSGLVFSDLREYIAGDDVKHIHWKVTARTGKAYVKSFEEDRQQRVVVAVDISNSTNHGVPKTKHLKALEFAAVISMLAQQSHDQLGLCLFSNHIEEFFPPTHSRRQFQKVMLSLLKHRQLAAATDLKASISEFLKQQRRPSIVFLVSDFLAPPFEPELRLLARRHDLICVLLEDSFAASVPRAGITEFQDAESGKTVLLDTSSPGVRRHLEALQRKRVENFQESCRLAGADFMRIEEGTLRPLADLMHRRHARAH
ncbi:MAG: DUF58 domain-containing protein [Deltaproteobacteria bacterium]|nr:DUF58 domain-containing protein [Deltaproteobacteria bacterium]